MSDTKIHISYFDQFTSFFSSQELTVLLGVMAFVVFLYALLLYIIPFQSDESVYTYGGYLIAQGQIPYRDVFLAHPPLMYLVYALLIRLFGANYMTIRFFNIGLFLGICILSYIFAKLALHKLTTNKFYPLLVVILCAFYPSVFLLHPGGLLLENLLTLFSLAMVIVYLKFRQNLDKRLLFLIGLLAGLAMLTTLRSVFFIGALCLFHIISLIWCRNFKQLFVDALITIAGIAIPLTSLFIALYCWSALPQFYNHLIRFPSLFPMSFEERFFNLAWYINSMIPLIILAVVGTFARGVHVAKSQDKSRLSSLFPMHQYWIVFLILFIGLSSRFHYFFYITPYLALLSVIGLFYLKQFTFNVSKGKYATFIVCSLVLIGFTTAQTVDYTFEKTATYFQDDPYVDIHNYIGRYISNVTEPTDKIWTSEGAIGFLSQREIVAPNSTDWPFICFFADVLGASADGDVVEASLVTPNDFGDAIQENDVKVIVVIQGKGWVPYPDSIIWNGFNGQDGIKNYVQDYYECTNMVTSESVPYIYFIWVKV